MHWLFRGIEKLKKLLKEPHYMVAAYQNDRRYELRALAYTLKEAQEKADQCKYMEYENVEIRERFKDYWVTVEMR